MRTTIYLHADRDRTWEVGEKLGLKGEALSMFRHACTEVEIQLEVKKTGEATIVGCDGRRLV